MPDDPTHDEDATEDDIRQRDGRKASGEMSAAMQAKIAKLALKEAEGKQEVDHELAALMEGAPEDVRTEIVERFRAIVQEIKKDQTPEPLEMTPERELELRKIQAHERMMMSFLLGDKTREKIRRMMLSAPGLFERVVSIGEELSKRGVFVNTARQQITSADLGTVTLQPDLANAKEKDKEKDAVKGR